MRKLPILAALGLMACAAARSFAENPALKVVTLSTVLTEIAQQVGGPGVGVQGLVQPGVDPHTFNPSPADIRALVDADLILASGLNLEVYLDRLVANIAPKGRVVAVGDSLPEIIVRKVSGGQEEPDPHWWHSIGDMLLTVDRVEREFARARPDSAPLFLRNAAVYSNKLTALKIWVAAEMKRLPENRRQLVTSHDAFGYFARDYGFTVHSISGLSTEGEADARRVAALIDLVRRQRIRAVFAESSVNPRLVENLVMETDVRMGGTLFADGLGPVGSGAETYEAMYRHNVKAIVDGLTEP